MKLLQATFNEICTTINVGQGDSDEDDNALGQISPKSQYGPHSMCRSQGCLSQDMDGFSGNHVTSVPIVGGAPLPMGVPLPALKVAVEAALTSNKVPIIECFSILYQVVDFCTSQEYIGEHLVDGHQN